MAVLHRAHTSGFCSALEQLSHSVALLLSLLAAASSARPSPWHLVSLGTLVKRQAAWANRVALADGGATERRRALFHPAAYDTSSDLPKYRMISQNPNRARLRHACRPHDSCRRLTTV